MSRERCTLGAHAARRRHTGTVRRRKPGGVPRRITATARATATI